MMLITAKHQLQFSSSTIEHNQLHSLWSLRGGSDVVVLKQVLIRHSAGALMRHVHNPAAPNSPPSAASAIAFLRGFHQAIPKRFVRLLGQSIRMAHDNGHRFFIVGYYCLMLGFLVETGHVRILANVLAVDSMLLDTKLCC